VDSGLTAAILAGVPIPLVLIGPDERIAGVNAAGAALIGEGQVGRHYLMAMRQPALMEVIEAARRGQVAQARLVLTGQAREQTFRVTASPVGAGVLAAFEDITDLEHAWQMRRDFVANVSHELRTPLTALLGFIETLKGAARDDPAARARFLAIMERETLRMNRLVQDLLSLSRVEAEERVRPTTPVDLVALIGQTAAALRGMTEAARVRLEITGQPGPVMVAADADQMTQVFHNLIENAVKYGGPDRTVTIRLGQPARDPTLRVQAVRVDVVDEGEGIDPVHLPRLTERFYRVDSHRSREQGGTGLGLAIVKHIVNRHRGRLAVESVPGWGSVFSVILPASME
jgi:two-component system phosphate regulon sensor histidine kinase PhoR